MSEVIDIMERDRNKDDWIYITTVKKKKSIQKTDRESAIYHNYNSLIEEGDKTSYL